jgi:hypothetical protein
LSIMIPRIATGIRWNVCGNNLLNLMGLAEEEPNLFHAYCKVRLGRAVAVASTRSWVRRLPACGWSLDIQEYDRSVVRAIP